MSKLTPKQERFAAEYLVDLNATQAAIRAGYSRRTAKQAGAENLSKPNLKARIDEALAKRAAKVEVDQQYVITNLVEVVERCLQRRPVYSLSGKQVQDEDGNNLWTFNANGANKALESLGKHLGMFTDKVESKLDGEISIRWQN